MDEKIPELTLNPDLTVETEVKEDKNLTEAPKQPAPEAGPELSALSEAEQKAVADFATKIDIRDAQQVLQYGAAAQKSIADFSETALGSAKTKDIDGVSQMVTGLLSELRGFDADEAKKGGFLGLFHKASRSMDMFRAKYEKASVNVDNIAHELEKQQLTLMKDVEILDQMYEKNLGYYKMLTMYILAGQMKIARERETTLASMREIAKRTGLPQDAQSAKDFEDMCLRFEKKLHDLELTRVVCLQMGPQIRLLQNNDTALSEKILTSIVNTIPLWKSQMVLALGISHSKAAMEAQREVTNMTNELLRKNADTLKMATVETAKESERSVVDIETLKHTNESLISTLDEVMQIQKDGAQKRKEAETELRKIEGELKMKLLEARS